MKVSFCFRKTFFRYLHQFLVNLKRKGWGRIGKGRGRGWRRVVIGLIGRGWVGSPCPLLASVTVPILIVLFTKDLDLEFDDCHQT